MSYNNLFYKYQKFLRNDSALRERLVATILSVALAYGVSSIDTSNNLEKHVSRKSIISNSLVNFSGEMSLSLLKYDNLDKDPFLLMLESLDFSDIPVYDGTLSTSVSIARFVRNALVNVPNDMKLEFILEHFKMPLDEFDVVQAVTHGEAKAENAIGEGNRYEDAFAVITSIYNRMTSKTKCGYAKLWLHKDGPISIYDHVIAPLQYQPYGNDDYKYYLGNFEGESYQAVLDALFSISLMEEGLIDAEVVMHYYMDFLASGQGYSYSVSFVPGGNEFAYELLASDVIPLEERYYYKEQVMEDEATLSLSR